MIFVYILANMALRPTIQKVLGFAGPRQAMQSMGMFGMPAQ